MKEWVNTAFWKASGWSKWPKLVPYLFLPGGNIRTAAWWSVAAFAHAHIDSGVSDGGGRERNCFRHNCPDSIAARRTSYGRAVIEIRCPLGGAAPTEREEFGRRDPIVRGFCVAGFSPSPPQKEGPCWAAIRIPIQWSETARKGSFAPSAPQPVKTLLHSVSLCSLKSAKKVQKIREIEVFA